MQHDELLFVHYILEKTHLWQKTAFVLLPVKVSGAIY